MAGAFSVYGSNEQIFGADEQVRRRRTSDLHKAYTIRQSGEDLSSTFPIRSANGPGWHAPHPPPAGASSSDAVSHDLRQQPLPDLAPPGRDRAQDRPHSRRTTDAHRHRLFGAPGQSSTEGLNRPGLKLAGDGPLA